MSKLSYPTCCCGCGQYPVTADDFYPGAFVRINPHVWEKYGSPDFNGKEKGFFKPNVAYEIEALYEGPKGSESNPVFYIKGHYQRLHHTWFYPDRFMSMINQALRENEKHKADKERYYHAESQKTD